MIKMQDNFWIHKQLLVDNTQLLVAMEKLPALVNIYDFLYEHRKAILCSTVAAATTYIILRKVSNLCSAKTTRKWSQHYDFIIGKN